MKKIIIFFDFDVSIIMEKDKMFLEMHSIELITNFEFIHVKNLKEKFLISFS